MRLLQFYLPFLIRYLRYYFLAQTKYDVHSPFVADFIARVYEDDRWYYAFSTTEVLRKKMLQVKTELRVKDLGAGSAVFENESRRLCDLVRYTAISPLQGRLLFRLVNWHKPSTLLELGTSVGISAIYQASAAQTAQMITVEGDGALAQLARQNLKLSGLDQVAVVEGAFKNALPEALKQLAKLDFVYIDGDHRSDHTLAYFEQCMTHVHEDSLVVIGDIHWSSDMETAWKQLCSDSRVSLSIDLFDFGLLFFRSENKEKQHFTLIQAKRKPWRIGLF